MRLKRIPYEYIVLTVSFFIIAFFMIILTNFYFDFSDRDFLNNGLYSEDMQRISVQSPMLQQSENADIAYRHEGIDYYIYKNLGEWDTDRRAVYFSNDFWGIAGFIDKGRYFTADDFTEDVSLAVVGSDISDIIEQDGERYVGYNGTLYKIIGQFRRTGTDIDNIIYFNLNAVLQRENASGVYSIDGKAENVESIIQKISEALGDGLELSKINYERFNIGLSIHLQLIFILAIVSSICNLFVICYFYTERQRYKTAVKKLCGYTKKRITEYYLKSITFIVFIAIVLTLIGLRIADDFLQLGNLTIHNYTLVFGTLLASGIITAMRIALNIGKVDISSALK